MFNTLNRAIQIALGFYLSQVNSTHQENKKQTLKRMWGNDPLYTASWNVNLAATMKASVEVPQKIQMTTIPSYTTPGNTLKGI